MKKIIFLIILSIFILGCGQGDDNLSVYKGIPSAEIPGDCLAYRDDICSLFDCMVDLCWCKESPDAILVEGNTVILTEEEAMQHVEDNLGLEIKNAVELNNIFFNVFSIDDETYTVAKDGTIFLTVCGV